MSANKDINVPLLDLKAQYANIREPIRQAIDEVCDSQWFVLGPNVKELEERIAEYSNCEQAIGVSSGTDALLLALMALGVGPGDAVITTPYTFFATGGTIARLGARPIYCDIERDTFNLDADAVRNFVEGECDRENGVLKHRATGDTVRALMPVHLFGQTADMEKFGAIAREFGLRLVEDAAQSIGSEYADGRRAGSQGDIGCFSFFPSKNLGAFGDGGMCTANDPDLAERMRVMRVHGGKPKYYHAVVGGNFRLDALQAAVLLVKLRHLDDWSAGRQENAARYDTLLSDSGLDNIETPVLRTGRRHIYNQYVIRVERRDELREHLKSRNIGTEVYYPVPLHLQKCFSNLGYSEGDCPVSEEAANTSLAIPIYPELSEEQQAHVVRSIVDFYS